MLMIDTFQKKKIQEIMLEINQPVHKLHHHQSLDHHFKHLEK